jgi:hypothetical protein
MYVVDLPRLNSVKIGSLYLKPSVAEDWMTRSCRMVLGECADRSLPLFRRGSSTLVKFRSKDYVVFTRHQLDIPRGKAPDDDVLNTVRVSSAYEDHLRNIPLQNCFFDIGNPDEEFHDLFICHAAAHWRSKTIDAPHFFQIEPFAQTERHISWIVGYPTIDGVIDEYHETFEPGVPGTINMKRVLMDCRLDHTFKSSASYYRRYTHTREGATMDGFSGGAVFSLIGNLDDLQIVLDGIVVRAGQKDIYVVDSNFLTTALMKAAADSDKASVKSA